MVRALPYALAALALAGPNWAADKQQKAQRLAQEVELKQAEAERLHSEAERRQARVESRQAEEAERQQLKQLGYELRKPFRDCPDCPEMVVIPAGTFAMGSPPDEAGRYSSEAPQHRVSLGMAFALGRTEVTQGQWRALMGSNPSRFSRCGDDCPVEQVSWDDAQEFVHKLADKTGKRYRLPTEAEWEYAARAGTTTPFNTGNCIDAAEANHDGSFDYHFCHGLTRTNRQRTLPVASFAPNAFALYDMHGNVWEWVADCWHDNYAGAPADGSNWADGSCDKRVLRGGSWKVEPRSLRSAERNWEWPGDHGDSQGFRVARTLF